MTASKKNDKRVAESSIELVEGRSKKGSSGHEFYWHIYSDKVRSGYVYIDLVEDQVLGKHASIHIFLNKKSQGKGIGRVGYREACVRSGLNKIYAHMRKNNIASKKAALAAGFKEIEDKRFSQLLMVWNNVND